MISIAKLVVGLKSHYSPPDERDAYTYLVVSPISIPLSVIAIIERIASCEDTAPNNNDNYCVMMMGKRMQVFFTLRTV